MKSFFKKLKAKQQPAVAGDVTEPAQPPQLVEAPAVPLKDQFTHEEITEALGFLSKEIEQSKTLKGLEPITLIALNGFVSVAFLKNRPVTQDVCYILDPRLPDQSIIDYQLKVSIDNVATANGYSRRWANNEMAQFVVTSTKLPLFLDSVDQGILLYKSDQLVIYAAKWDWALARKLKRIGTYRRDDDYDDAVTMLYQINQRNGAPLDRQVAKSWNNMTYSPIEDWLLDELTKRYQAKYAKVGMVTALTAVTN